MAVASKTTPRLTKAEQEKILAEAALLIKEPANWTTGNWKCPVYQVDEKGKFVKDEDGYNVPAVDLFNRPVAQYCVEGAINEAAFRVLGEERARRFGVSESDSDMTDLLGLNVLAQDLYGFETALELNDSYADAEDEGHSVIMDLLRSGLEAIRAKTRRR